MTQYITKKENINIINILLNNILLNNDNTTFNEKIKTQQQNISFTENDPTENGLMANY